MPEIDGSEKRQGLHLACFRSTAVESKENFLAPTPEMPAKCESQVSRRSAAQFRSSFPPTLTPTRARFRTAPRREVYTPAFKSMPKTCLQSMARLQVVHAHPLSHRS